MPFGQAFLHPDHHHVARGRSCKIYQRNLETPYGEHRQSRWVVKVRDDVLWKAPLQDFDEDGQPEWERIGKLPLEGRQVKAPGTTELCLEIEVRGNNPQSRN